MLAIPVFPGIVPVDLPFHYHTPPRPNITGYEFPARWLETQSLHELEASKKESAVWADDVREAAGHAWRGYVERAWGHDQIHPKRGEPNMWFNLGLSIVEWLDTLWLLGMMREFDEAQQWVEEQLDFETADTKLDSFFEATIRLLGGLLGAHSLSGREIFLAKAQELGNRLISAWPEMADLPNAEVDISANVSKHVRGAGVKGIFGIAEVGSCQLEFRYLSHHTGDPTYAIFADRAFNAILDATPDQGLISIFLLGNRNPKLHGSTVTMGALGDSYYEYLLKQYLQTSQSEHRFLVRWKLAMDDMMTRLVHRSNDGYSYVAKEIDGKVVHEFDHLSCFVAGMLVQGLHELPPGSIPESYQSTAAEITRTCRAMYDTVSGLAPEIADFSKGHLSIKKADAFSLLRPEAVEAMYYMWYYTGEHKYRQWAHNVLQALNRSARTTYGFSAVESVDSHEHTMRDVCESFFYAETLKYLFLIQADPNLVPLDQYVFNTEGHPLKNWDPSSITTAI
jgi:mannosyl-oligosaccharide alpha-1,2-mannosidase